MKKLPKPFVKNTLHSIHEWNVGRVTSFVFGRAGKKQALRGSIRRSRQPGSVNDRSSIPADVDAAIAISAQLEDIPDAGDDSDWVRNPITPELLDVLNGRNPPPLDPMIYSDDFDNPEPLVLTQRESLMIIDMMENPPPRNAAFLGMMEEHEKWKDAQWLKTKPIVLRSCLIEPQEDNGSIGEMIVPLPNTLLKELGWAVGDVLDIKINEKKQLVLRKK